MSANVLIVDDSATMRRMIRRTLTISGLDIGEAYEASNGIQALAQMAEHEIAALILDINMPLMNGLQLIKRMRADPRLAQVPVVVASTEGSDTRIRELLTAGVLGFVRKPFQPEQLRDVLQPILGLREEPAGTEQTAAGDAF
jgi:two-component system chemotaxis response regulator CheY